MATRTAVLLFVVGSIAIVAYSWRSIRHPGSHGAPRFLAFECILGILIVNAPAWFSRPLAPRQLLSWCLLLTSAVVAVAGFRALHVRGRPARPPSGSPLRAFEATTALVTSGPYRWIRHPLYAALVCLAWGAALKTASLASFALALLASAFLVATAVTEERENLERFGSAYRDYMRRTQRFVPWPPRLKDAVLSRLDRLLGPGDEDFDVPFFKPVVSGTVIAKATGLPIPDVTIEASPRWVRSDAERTATRTDAAGHFSLTLTGTGLYTIAAGAERYRSRRRYAFVRTGSACRLDFALASRHRDR